MINKKNTAIITGASQGIGYATAVLFLEQGWRIISCSRTQPPKDITDHKQSIAHFNTDLTDDESVSIFMESANKILSGDPKKIKKVFDTWKFSKNINSTNPNWLLIDTEC